MSADHADQLSGLLQRSRDLELELDAASGGVAGAGADRAALADTALRLRDSVSRPLSDALAAGGNQEGQPIETQVRAGQRADSEPTSSSLAQRVWDLATAATRIRVALAACPELQEATAALQDLAVQLAPADGPQSVAARLAQLEQLQSGLVCSIQVSSNGPYLVTNANQLVNWLGESQPTRPQMALCRCGASRRKPFCDGTHAQIGFRGEKDPNRVPDRRDPYVGQQVTVLDNRGTCQHSGLCTDRLATVFRMGTEPFVAPSGGRMDEIIRAVRDCPSGALSYAVDGVEAREDVDRHGTREPMIEVSKDGPYRVTGAISLTVADGAPQRNAGASLEHYALCRCGQSQNKPFCSGMHWYVDFKDPVPDPDRQPTLFEWAGGLPALTRMTRLFYEKYVPQDPLLAPLFANMSEDHPQRVAQWLGEVFCGPKRYSEGYGGYPRMISQHIGKGLTEDKRARWVQLIVASAQEAGLPADPEFRAAFSAYIEWGSRLALENSQPGAKPPEHMPMPRWDWSTAAGPPGSRISALQPAAEQERPVVLPHPDEPVSFEQHITTLFRHSDRQSMTFAFDLWAYDDVKRNAHAILERVRAGTMPCDGAWPSAKVDAFERWVTTGMRH
jgi:CDGSH-type Zn-finger protein/truncated hemoglobin YjbI